jgi:hypothetical protein
VGYVDTTGIAVICLTVTCVDRSSRETSASQCCTDVDVNKIIDDAPIYPPAASDTEPICDNGGPYSIYADSSTTVALKGSSSCPNGYAVLEATWSSVAAEVDWDGDVYQNPARVRISTPGNYIVCQTVFCVDVVSQETKSTECCTTVDVHKGHGDSSYTEDVHEGSAVDNNKDDYDYDSYPDDVHEGSAVDNYTDEYDNSGNGDDRHTKDYDNSENGDDRYTDEYDDTGNGDDRYDGSETSERANSSRKGDKSMSRRRWFQI